MDYFLIASYNTTYIFVHLAIQRFRHGYRIDDFAKRAATFESVYAVTKKDRVSNGTAAEERRVKNMEANSAHDDLTDEDHALTTGGISIDFDEEDIY